MTDEPRAYTTDECRQMFYAQIWQVMTYWKRLSADKLFVAPGQSEIDARLEGFLHSLLCIFDGVSGIPGFDIVPTPHPDDEEFNRNEGENWWPSDGKPINEGMMHEEYPWPTPHKSLSEPSGS